MRHSTLNWTSRLSVAALLSIGVVTASGVSAASVHRTANARSATSHVTLVRGTVVADNTARHTLVVSESSGALRTLRFSSARHVAIGSRITSRTTRLGDGTLRASTLKVYAKSRSTHLRAVVVSSHASRLELSGGGSVFTVVRRGPAPRTSGSSSLQPGDIVNVTVDFTAGTLDETTIEDVGTSNLIDLQGVLSSLSLTTGQLTINVENGATTTVSIPTSITLPSTIAVGDQVEVLVDYQNQTFSLVTIVDDTTAANDSSSGVSQSGGDQGSNIEIEGLVTAASTTSVTIQTGDNAAPVTVYGTSGSFTVPTVGDQVHVVATMMGTVLTLVSIDVQSPEGDQSQSMTTEAEGQVVSMSPPTSTSVGILVIQPNDQASPVSFTVPTTMDVSSIAVGDQVDATGTLVGGVLTLTEFEVQGSDGSQNGDNAVAIDGLVTAVSAVSPESLTLAPQDGAAAVTIAVPATLDISSIAVGNEVNASATVVAGVLTLVSFEVQ